MHTNEVSTTATAPDDADARAPTSSLAPEVPQPVPVVRPWYREPWPWMLIAPPATAIVAGLVTCWLAISSADGLVADDYYKRGLAINQDLRRDRVAVERGIDASVSTRDGVLRIALAGDAAPGALFVRLVHAVRAGQDQRLRLPLVAAGVYETALDALPPGHWRVVVEDPQGQWRIVKERL